METFWAYTGGPDYLFDASVCNALSADELGRTLNYASTCRFVRSRAGRDVILHLAVSHRRTVTATD